MAERREAHRCWCCNSLFALVYEALDEEGLEAAPVNCPECGRINYLPVSRSAAAGRIYRPQKIERAAGTSRDLPD